MIEVSSDIAEMKIKEIDNETLGNDNISITLFHKFLRDKYCDNNPLVPKGQWYGVSCTPVNAIFVAFQSRYKMQPFYPFKKKTKMSKYPNCI